MKKREFQRYAVAFVALIFIGSMAGAMLYSAGNETGAPELPKELIQAQLSDSQRQFILSKGHIIIDAEIPSSCFLECASAKRGLEQLVLAFNPAAYLVEAATQSASSDIPVSMESYRGTKKLPAFNQTEVEDFICGNTPFRVNECVLRKMDFQVPESITPLDSSGQNSTRNSSGNNSSLQQPAIRVNVNGTNTTGKAGAGIGNATGAWQNRSG